MLDFVPSTPEGVNDRIPMDLSQYLLAASPPSFGFDFMALSLQHTQHSLNQPQSPTSPDNYQSSNNFNTSCSFHHTFPHTVNNGVNLNKQNNGVLKPIIICSDSYSSDSEGECSADSPQSPGRSRKKVSFADHKGLALAQVRFVKEGPDEPPQLDSKVLAFLTQGANAGVTSSPPIKLCFPQPASDYMAFRDKVIHNFVSLENVILEDYTVRGTIKVNNITFEKRVFVRVSLDEWTSCKDYEAVYVPGPGSGFADCVDTFSFNLDISHSFDASNKIQFAVCFEENGKEHWDNNGGSNYCIVGDDHELRTLRPLSPPSVNPRWLPEKDSNASWTEFSVWRDGGSSVRYY